VAAPKSLAIFLLCMPPLAWASRAVSEEATLVADKSGASARVSEAGAALKAARAAHQSALERSAAGVDAAAHALRLAQRLEASVSEEEVSKTLAEHPSLKRAVAAHASATKADAGMAASALVQRARAALTGERAKGLDRVLGGKTNCACFATELRGYMGREVKLADLDSEGKWKSQDQCAHRCPATCHSRDTYKFDPWEAHSIGAEGVSQAMTASKCENDKCSCLDSRQTVEQASGVGDISHDMGQYDTPAACLYQCADMCDSYDSSTVDWEGLCLDEWDFGLAREYQSLARD